MTKSEQPKRAFITALNLTVAGLVLAGIALVPRGDRLTVVVAPWSSPGHIMDVVKEAGGSLVESSALSWVVVSQGESSDFAQRLYSAGAIMVLDGSLLAGCLKRGM